MLIAMLFVLAAASTASAQPFVGEADLRLQLTSLSQQVGSAHGTRVVADYLTTLDQLKPARDHIITIAHARQLSIDLWVVASKTGTLSLPSTYDHVIVLPSTDNLKFKEPSDVYFDTKPIADLVAWLDSPEVTRNLRLRQQREAARLGVKQVRTTAVALITLYKLIDRNKERGLIVARLDDLPAFVEVMNGLGITSIVIVQTGVSQPRQLTPEEKRRSS